MNKCRFPNAYAIPQAFERKMKEIKIYERVEVECEYVKVLQYNYLILIITVRVVWVFATILLESNGHACPTEEEKKTLIKVKNVNTHYTWQQSNWTILCCACINPLPQWFIFQWWRFIFRVYVTPCTVHRPPSVF